MFEFQRSKRLPPYVFAIVNQLKMEARRRGEDIIDLGMGNPDLPTPRHIIEKLCEAAQNPKNHRYSASRGITQLRVAITEWYRRRFGVNLDPETEVVVTIGAKEGLSHLSYATLAPGDVVLTPTPAYPIHPYSAILAGAEVRYIPTGKGYDFFDEMEKAFKSLRPKPKMLIINFPHNPTTECVEEGFFKRVVNFAKENDITDPRHVVVERGPQRIRQPGAGAQEAAVEDLRLRRRELQQRDRLVLPGHELAVVDVGELLVPERESPDERRERHERMRAQEGERCAQAQAEAASAPAGGAGRRRRSPTSR